LSTINLLLSIGFQNNFKVIKEYFYHNFVLINVWSMFPSYKAVCVKCKLYAKTIYTKIKTNLLTRRSTHNAPNRNIVLWLISVFYLIIFSNFSKNFLIVGIEKSKTEEILRTCVGRRLIIWEPSRIVNIKLCT
jgi:hypothetical protein